MENLIEPSVQKNKCVHSRHTPLEGKNHMRDTLKSELYVLESHYIKWKQL